VQELLNQVVARKHTLLDKDNNEVQYNYLKEDGIYGQKSEEAIELLRSSFEPVSWDTSDVMKNLIRVYDNPPFNPEKWFTRVVDKDLLVGKRQYYSSSESDPNRHKDGLLELYDNFVVPFVDSIISRGEDFCENPTSDVSWLGRIGYDGLFVRPGGLKAAISILSVPGGGSSNDTLALSFDTTFVDSIVVDTVITDTVVNDTVYQDTTIDVDTLIIDTLLAVEIDTLDGVSCSERQTAVSYSWGSADSPERFRVRIRDQEGHDTLSNWIKYTYPFHQTGLNSKEYWIASYNLGWDRSRVNDADTQDYRIIGTEIKDPRDTTKLLYNPNYYNPNRWSGIDCNGFVQTCANYGYKYMATLIGEKYDTFNFVPRLHNEDSTAIDIWNVRGKRNIYTVFTNGTREIPANRRSIIKKGDVVRSSGHITLVYEADSEEPKSSILIQSDGVFTRKRNDTTFFARKVNRIWPLIEVFPSGSDLGRFYIWK